MGVEIESRRTACYANHWVTRPKIGNFPYLILILLFIVAAPLRSQRLQLSGPKFMAGEEIVVEVSLKSPSGSEPSGLQWEMQLPTGVTLNDKSAATGASASAAGKSLACNFEGKEPGTGTCILAGGDRPIHDGPIALFTMRVTEDRHPLVFRIERGVAASRDAKRREMPAVKLQLKRRD